MKWFLLLTLSCLLFVSADCSGYLQYHYTRRPVNNGECRIIPVYVDQSFTTQQKLSIADGIASWNYALNNYMRLEAIWSFDMGITDINHIQDNGGIAILAIDSSNSIVPITADDVLVQAFTTTYRAFPNTHYIYMIVDRLRSTKTRFVDAIRHEIGHGLLASHIYDHPSIMNDPYVEEYAHCIDQYALHEVAIKNHLDETKLNYCSYEQ